MMKPLPLYIQLLWLEASNDCLIQKYELLSDTREIEEDLLFEELEERLNLRLTIQKEIQSEIHENFASQKWGILDEAFMKILPVVVKATEEFNGITYKNSWENCNYWERKNVKKYYQILFLPDLPKNMTDLLLEQKSKVEGYLLGSPL